MANLQVKNIPDTLHERLRSYARENRCSISAAVLAAVERELAMWEWRGHMARRPETDLGVDTATLIAEERLSRDREIGSWYPDDHLSRGGRSSLGMDGIDIG
ncbi:MAG: toxin-antitoxin system HicB family antitoxin [bacterium]|nr:toxin-antitoxin system HicB family antitoxin [bacterium]